MQYDICIAQPDLRNSKFIKISIPWYFDSDLKEIQFHLSRIPLWSSFETYTYRGLYKMLDTLVLDDYNGRYPYITREFISFGADEGELSDNFNTYYFNKLFYVDRKILFDYLGYEVEAIGLPMGICFYILDENYNFIHINNDPDSGSNDYIFVDGNETQYNLWDLKTLNLPERFYLRVFPYGYAPYERCYNKNVISLINKEKQKL